MSLLVCASDYHVVADDSFDIKSIGDDIWINVICLLTVKDFLMIGVTSKYFHSLENPQRMKINNYWKSKVKKLCFIDSTVAVPSNKWYPIFRSLVLCTPNICDHSTNKSINPIDFIGKIKKDALILKFPSSTILMAALNNCTVLFEILLSDWRLNNQSLTVDNIIKDDKESFSQQRLKLTMPLKIQGSNEWLLESLRIAIAHSNISIIRIILKKLAMGRKYDSKFFFQDEQGNSQTFLSYATQFMDHQIVSLLLENKKARSDEPVTTMEMLSLTKKIGYHDCHVLYNICSVYQNKWDDNNDNKNISDGHTDRSRLELTSDIIKRLIIKSGTGILNGVADLNMSPLYAAVKTITSCNKNKDKDERQKMEYFFNIVKTLLGYDFTDMNTRLYKDNNVTAFMVAISCNDIKLVELFLNTDKKRGNSHVLVHRDQIDLLELDDNGMNIFHYITKTGNRQILTTIYNHIFNIRYKKVQDYNHKLRLMSHLINWQDDCECTPYVIACKYWTKNYTRYNYTLNDSKLFFKKLINKYKVDITIKDCNGKYGSQYIKKHDNDKHNHSCNKELEWIHKWLMEKESTAVAANSKEHK